MESRREGSQAIAEWMSDLGLNPIYVVALFSSFLSAVYLKEWRRGEAISWTRRLWIVTVWLATALLIILSLLFILQ